MLTEFKDVIFLLLLGRTGILTHHIQLRPDAKPSRNTMWRVKKAYEKHALGGRAEDAGGRAGRWCPWTALRGGWRRCA